MPNNINANIHQLTITTWLIRDHEMKSKQHLVDIDSKHLK